MEGAYRSFFYYFLHLHPCFSERTAFYSVGLVVSWELWCKWPPAITLVLTCWSWAGLSKIPGFGSPAHLSGAHVIFGTHLGIQHLKGLKLVWIPVCETPIAFACMLIHCWREFLFCSPSDLMETQGIVCFPPTVGGFFFILLLLLSGLKHKPKVILNMHLFPGCKL